MYNYQSNKNGWKDCDQEYRPNDKCDCEPPDKCNHESHGKKQECCCKKSMKKTLELLTNPTIQPYINFNQFGFIGKRFLVGTQTEATPTNNDNLLGVTATFNGFDSCNCDLIKILSTDDIYYPVPGTASLGYDMNHISLCNIEALAFAYNPAKVTPNITSAQFESALAALLDEYNKRCFAKCDDCCCNDGVFNSIFNSFTPNVINLTAGWLAVESAKVLGRVGNILVLSNTLANSNTIYFVCLDAVEFINY